MRIFLLVIGVLSCFCALTYCQNSKSQSKSFGSSEREGLVIKTYSIPQYGIDLKKSYPIEFPSVILDGIIINQQDIDIEISDSLRITRSLLSNDQDKLRSTGIKNSARGLHLFETDGTKFHSFIYSNYREKVIPLTLWDRILPIIVDGILYPPTKYSSLDHLKTSEIKKVSFEKWDSESLAKFDNIAFGAIIVRTQ